MSAVYFDWSIYQRCENVNRDNVVVVVVVVCMYVCVQQVGGCGGGT